MCQSDWPAALEGTSFRSAEHDARNPPLRAFRSSKKQKGETMVDGRNSGHGGRRCSPPLSARSLPLAPSSFVQPFGRQPLAPPGQPGRAGGRTACGGAVPKTPNPFCATAGWRRRPTSAGLPSHQARCSDASPTFGPLRSGPGRFRSSRASKLRAFFLRRASAAAGERFSPGIRKPVSSPSGSPRRCGQRAIGCVDGARCRSTTTSFARFCSFHDTPGNTCSGHPMCKDRAIDLTGEFQDVSSTACFFFYRDSSTQPARAQSTRRTSLTYSFGRMYSAPLLPVPPRGLTEPAVRPGSGRIARPHDCLELARCHFRARWQGAFGRPPADPRQRQRRPHTRSFIAAGDIRLDIQLKLPLRDSLGSIRPM